MAFAVLDLSCTCLSFDFIGTHPDESSEDFVSIQIPSNWRTAFHGGKAAVLHVLELFIKAPSDEIREKCMEFVVQLTSIRRSIFQNPEARSAYLTSLLQFCIVVLKEHINTLQSKKVYVTFCRVLYAIKSNHKLDDIAEVSCYSEWIRLIMEFTKASFKSWQHSSAAIQYLTMFWSGIVLSIPYMRWDSSDFLDTFIPQIAEEFLTTRLMAVNAGAREDTLDDFYDKQGFEWQLRQLPMLNRFQYKVTYEVIAKQFDTRFKTYKDLVDGNSAMNSQQLLLCEAELSWLVYAIGSTVMGTVVAPILICTNTKQRQEVQAGVDAALCARCFRIMDVLERRLGKTDNLGAPPTEGTMHLNLAIIYFCNCFRRTHIGSLPPWGIRNTARGNTSDKLFEELGKHLLAKITQKQILVYMIKKIDHDLRIWKGTHRVIEEVVNLFSDLITGYGSGKLMMQLDICKKFLMCHSPTAFPFMNEPQNFKLRTKFYSTMGRIVFGQHNLEAFNKFIEPFDKAFEYLANQTDFQRPEVKLHGIGLFRDLRGVVNAIFTSKNYQIFFDWIYPKNFHIFLRMFETWWETPEVVIPMLKFLEEFVDQKSHRIAFSCTSPNGIVLFKETSKVLHTYGERILNFMPKGADEDPYKKRYKGIMLCMKILSSSLNAQYVNYGVFKLYNDPALQIAINTVLKLVLTIKLETLQSYQKVAKAYYLLLEVLFLNHIEHLLELEPDVLRKILDSLHEGLNLSDRALSSLSARAFDYFFMWKWKESVKRTPSRSVPKFDEHFKYNMVVFRELLLSIFMRILKESALPNCYALCCPVFSLICLDRSILSAVEEWLVKQEPNERPKIQQAFACLFKNVEFKINESMRTTFTSNVTEFKKVLNGGQDDAGDSREMAS